MASQTGSQPSAFDGELILYTYFRSSCSARVRTAANLKGLSLTFKYVHLLKGEQRAPAYLDNVNPNGLVPTLVVKDARGKTITAIRESVAILEFLEEFFPDSRRRLLPADPVARGRVRELVNVIAADVQPVTNLRILGRVKTAGIEAKEWCGEFMGYGFQAYDRILAEGPTKGRYSVGDEITLADVVLAPAVEGAIRWGIDLDQYPNMKRVFEEITVLPEFVRGDWKHQEDTPEDLRVKD